MIAGASGIVGDAVARELLDCECTVKPLSFLLQSRRLAENHVVELTASSICLVREQS